MHAEKLYAGIRPGATLMSDGYEVYNGIAKAGGLTPWGWVHARRPFIKAADAIPMAARSQDQVASRFLQLIAKLYRAEALAKDWAPNRRVRLRSRYSRAVVREFERLLLANLHRVAPSSLLGETLQSAAEELGWAALYATPKAPQVELDSYYTDENGEPKA